MRRSKKLDVKLYSACNSKVNKKLLRMTLAAPREGKNSPTDIQVYLDSYAGKISRVPTLQTNNSDAQVFI